MNSTNWTGWCGRSRMPRGVFSTIVIHCSRPGAQTGKPRRAAGRKRVGEFARSGNHHERPAIMNLVLESWWIIGLFV